MKTKLVILGTGFGAFSLLRKLDASLFDVVVISPRNHFVFTPLLPSTTVGTIEFRSIIESIRRAYPGLTFHQAVCTGIDPAKKSVSCKGVADGAEFDVAYDMLVVAVGMVNNTFGVPGVEEHAFFLKEVHDARLIRGRIIDCFENAAEPQRTEEERRNLLHFVVVGGGPTGVEFAAEMHDFIKHDLRKYYPHLQDYIRITLLEAGGHLLSAFDQRLSEYTEKHFRRQQITVLTGSRVMRVHADAIELGDGTRISFGLVVWSTGNTATSFVRSTSFLKDKANRILIDGHLRVRDTAGVFALGDCAAVENNPFPMTAQVAEQQGKYLGRALTQWVKQQTPPIFQYKHMGMLAYIGGERALADLPAVKGRGFSTYLFWRSAYVTRLVSLKNKILVLFDWTKTMVFGRDISRF